MPERDHDTEATDYTGRSRRRRKRRSWGRRQHLGLKTTGIAAAVLVVGLVVVVLTWDHGREPFAQRVADAASVVGTPTPTTGGTAPGTTGQPTPSTSGTAPPGTTGVRGVITAVGTDRWTVKGNNGLDYTVIVTPATSFVRKTSFGDYGVGDTLVVKGALDKGTVTATTVTPGKVS